MSKPLSLSSAARKERMKLMGRVLTKHFRKELLIRNRVPDRLGDRDWNHIKCAILAVVEMQDINATVFADVRSGPGAHSHSLQKRDVDAANVEMGLNVGIRP